MRFPAKFLATAASIGLLLPVCGFLRDAAQAPSADIIVTAAPVYEPLAALRGGERFPKGAQLMLVHAGKAEPLVTGFAASADANISFDGKTVLFAGKQAASDPWQIWELTLANHSLRKLIATTTDAVRPFYLPGGRMIWAQRAPWGFQLESAEDGHLPGYTFLNPTAGPGVLPLTYTQASAFPADVLADGRILFEAGFPLGSARRLNFIWSTPMARASSRTAAITAERVGEEDNWPRAMWFSRTELRWRVSHRRWQLRLLLPLRTPNTLAQLPRRHRGHGW